jgi:hypothetical protein
MSFPFGQNMSSYPEWTWIVVGAVALIVVAALGKALFGRKRTPPERPPDLSIDVVALGAHGPPSSGIMLELHSAPVRLAAVVLAPAGRVRELPPLNELNDVFDAILPGLADVVAAHKPLIRKWPAQLSVGGFAHTFFSQVRLPGQGGKGTPWCLVAGLFKIEGQPSMAGLVLRTEKPRSSHRQEIIDGEDQWLGVLRARGG